MNLKLYLCSALPALSAFAPTIAQPQPDIRPNILWIVSEDNAASFVGAYGRTMAHTPNIDRLAAEGVLYKNVYCVSPVSAPARSALITGMCPTSIGTHHMRSYNAMPAFIRFFPEFLREAGFFTANNPKEDYNTSNSAENAWDQSGRHAEYRNRAPGQPFFQVYNITISHESQLFTHPETLRHDPAKVTLPPYLPDLPEKRFDRALYYERIEDMDAIVGRILQQLEDDGLAESTIVFYFSDNGGVLGRSKRFVYEAGLHVPLIIRFPEKFQHLAPAPPGSRKDRLVTFIDFAPTMLSLIGLEIPDYMQGFAFLGSQKTEEPEFMFAFRDRMDERYDMQRVVRCKRFKYIRNYMPHRIYGQHLFTLWRAHGIQAWERACRDGYCNEYQMRFWQTKPVEELFDLKNDPYEINNLAFCEEHAPILEKMREAHRRRTMEFFDVGFVPEPELLSRLKAEETTAYDFIRSNNFPFQRVFETAQMATMGKAKDFDKIAKRLNDDEAVVRFWAAVGCAIQPELAKSQRERLFEIAYTDSSQSVRIAAIEAIFKIGYQNEALVLIRDLVMNDTDDFVRLFAFNTIDTFCAVANDIRREIAATYPAAAEHILWDGGRRLYAHRIIEYWRRILQ